MKCEYEHCPHRCKGTGNSELMEGHMAKDLIVDNFVGQRLGTIIFCNSYVRKMKHRKHSDLPRMVQLSGAMPAGVWANSGVSPLHI